MSNPEMHSEVKVISTVDLDTAILPDQRHSLAVRCFGATDKGQVRTNNEDQFLVARLSKALQVLQTSLPQPESRQSSDCSHLFIVADGMGGPRGGRTGERAGHRFSRNLRARSAQVVCPQAGRGRRPATR